jgi:hypothetical protein
MIMYGKIDDNYVLDIARRLRAPAYWFTQVQDNKTGHWFSGSSAGHEGENDLPVKAAAWLEVLLQIIQAQRETIRLLREREKP